MPPSPSPPPSSLDHRKNKTRDSSFLQLSWKKYISGGKLQSIYWSERKIYFIDTPHLTARIDLHKNSDKAKHVSKRGGEGAVEVGGGGGTKSFIAESKSVAHFSCWMIFLTIKALSGTKLSNENEKAYLVDFSFWTDGNQCSGNFQILLNQGTFKFHKDVNNAYEYLVNILFWSRYASTIGNQFHKLQE